MFTPNIIFTGKAAEDGYEEIVIASGGNAGLAAACCSRLLGLKCRVFVPNRTSGMMKDKIAKEGANIQSVGDIWDEANDAALDAVRQSGRCAYVHPFDDPIVWYLTYH
jgi:threonine dehydratase